MLQHSKHKSHESAGMASLRLQRIMFRVRDAVKFGASRVCPMCNSGLALRRSFEGVNEGVK